MHEVVSLRIDEREGYRGPHGVQVRSIRNKSGAARVRTQERLGSLIAAAGVIWGVQEATKNLDELWKFSVLPPGPLEVCALGVLIWLYAKWQRSTKIG